MFNYMATLRDIDVNAFMSDHHICSCDGSPCIYQPAGHLEDVLTKGPKYREPQYFSWNNFLIPS